MERTARNVLKPLTAVCTSCRVDYYKARNLVIRGEVNGLQVEGRWFADERDLRRWKAQLGEKQTAATSHIPPRE
jgi:hypothetical protein